MYVYIYVDIYIYIHIWEARKQLHFSHSTGRLRDSRFLAFNLGSCYNAPDSSYDQLQGSLSSASVCILMHLGRRRVVRARSVGAPCPTTSAESAKV